MGDEDNVLTRIRYGGELGSGKSAFDFGRNAPRPIQPINVGLGDAGALPSCPIYMELARLKVGSGRTRDEVAAGTHVWNRVRERTRLWFPRSEKGRFGEGRTEKETDLSY